MKNTHKIISKNKSLPKLALISGLFVAISTTTACVTPAHNTENQPYTAANTQHSPKNDVNAPSNPQLSLTEQARHIQQALANGDYAAIIDDIHPTRGVTFSMYAYVQPDQDKTFSREQFAKYLNESRIRFTWGQKDGTGNLLITPLPDYLRSWVNAASFNDKRSVTVSINDSQAIGNSINNINEVYPKADYVEYYHNGTEKYAGMDWRALRLVFDEYQGRRYLVAIINDQWTI